MEESIRKNLTSPVGPQQERTEASQVVRRDGKLKRVTGNARDYIFQDYTIPPSSTKFHHLIAQMQLPDGSIHAVGTAELHQELSECFAEFAAVAPEDATLVASYVLLTWVADRLEFCPPLLLLASSPGDALPLLHVLRVCCRNALGLRSCVAAPELPSELEPTLIMDLSCLSPSRVRVIASANSRQFRQAVGERLVNTAMPKIILCREALSDFPTLQVALQPSCVNVPRTHVLNQLATRFQPRLLGYRMDFQECEFADHKFTVPGNSVALVGNSLLFAIQNVEQLRQQLLEIIDAEAQANLAEILGTPESLSVECIINAMHAHNVSSLTCGEIAQRANLLAEVRGETSKMKARGVGTLLRLLGLHTRRIPGKGRGILFDAKTRELAHQAAWARNLPAVAKPAEGCLNCKPKR